MLALGDRQGLQVMACEAANSCALRIVDMTTDKVRAWAWAVKLWSVE